MVYGIISWIIERENIQSSAPDTPLDFWIYLYAHRHGLEFKNAAIQYATYY